MNVKSRRARAAALALVLASAVGRRGLRGRNRTRSKGREPRPGAAADKAIEKARTQPQRPRRVGRRPRRRGQGGRRRRRRRAANAASATQTAAAHAAAGDADGRRERGEGREHGRRPEEVDGASAGILPADGGFAREDRARDRRLPRLPAPRRLARGRGREPAAPLPRPDVLGAARARIRGSRRARCSSSASRPRPTAATGRAASSRATPRAISSSRRSTGRASRTRRGPSRGTTGSPLAGAYVAAAARCAPPDNKPTPAEFARCRPFLVREIAALPRPEGRPRARRARVAGLDRGARRERGAAPRPLPPSRTGRRRGSAKSRLLALVPREPAEHVHGAPDAGDAGCGPGEDPGDFLEG